MAEEVAALVIRLEATQARFERDMRRAETTFSRSANTIERRASAVDARLSDVGRNFGRGFGPAIQQAGFQIGDFAVQVAGGSGVLRPFIQQGTQLISMFGPWGAVIGAAGATVGALAVSFMDAGDAADSLGDALSDLEAAGASVDDLNAQIANSSGRVREALTKERDATVDLLKARLALAQEVLGKRRAEIEAEAARDVHRQRISGAFGSEISEGLESVLPNDPRDVQRRVEANIAANPELAAELAAMERQMAVTEAGLEKLSTLTTTPTEPLFSVPTGGGKGGGGGGGGDAERRVKAIRDEIQAIEDRRDALMRESVGLQVSEREQVQLTAAYERQRIVEELLNKAREEGITLTPEQIAQAKALAAEIENLAVANYDMKEAQEAQAEAAKKAKERQDELAKSLVDVGNRMVSAIQTADSFADALANIGVEIANLVAQGLGGQGALGSVLGNIIPNLLGAGSFRVGGGTGNLNPYGNPGSFKSAKGNAFRAGKLIPFARGGIVSRPTVFPMANGAGLMGEAGPEAVLPLRRGPGGRLGVAGGGGGTTVNVYAPPGSEAREERSSSGGMEKVDIYIEQAVARGMRTPGSPIQRALSTSFGARPVTTRR